MEPRDLWRLERQYRAQGLELICGADEAGAGPLAGDVYAAAVILPFGLTPEGLNDSKQVSPKNRDRLFDLIRDELAHGIGKGVASVEQTMDILMIAKYFERIGDHATNIAEWVEFSITGHHRGEETE